MTKPVRLRWRIVQVATFVAFATVFVLGARLFVERRRPTYSQPKPQGGELTVEAALGKAGVRPVAIRGYVFNDGSLGLRLCNGRRSGSPPACIGPFVDLAGVDEGSFDVRHGHRDGAAVVWSPAAVAVYGELVGTRMHVQTVLG